MRFFSALTALALALPVQAQTRIDLRTQTKSVDFSSSSSTKPFKTGTSLPSSCTVGETFFKSDAPAGQNVYGCTSTNTWTVQGPVLVTSVFGRSGTVTAQTGDYSFGQISGTVANSQIASGVDAAKIGSGTVSNTVFGYLANVTSDIQAQLNGKAASSHSHTGGGDISGDIANATVGKIQNRAVASTTPSDGQTLVWSTANNQWQPGTISGSGSGATMASGLGDLRVDRTSATMLTIGANCSSTQPCNVRYGATVYRITTSATVTLASGSGTAFIYLTPGGTLTVGHNVSLSCTNCTAVSGVTAYPTDSLPLWRIDAVSGAWDSSGGLDYRAFLSTKTVTAGTGVVASESNGQTTVAVDTAVVGLRVAVPGSAAAACTAGQWAADSSYYYLCVATNTWRRSTLSSW